MEKRNLRQYIAISFVKKIHTIVNTGEYRNTNHDRNWLVSLDQKQTLNNHYDDQYLANMPIHDGNLFRAPESGAANMEPDQQFGKNLTGDQRSSWSNNVSKRGNAFGQGSLPSPITN